MGRILFFISYALEYYEKSCKCNELPAPITMISFDSWKLSNLIEKVFTIVLLI